MPLQPSCIVEKIRKVSFLAALLVLAMPTSVFAQAPAAVINGNLIEIPVLVVGDANISVTLSIVEGVETTELELISYTDVGAVDSEGASSFDGSTLTIPLIQLGEVSYRVELTLIGENPARFQTWRPPM